MRWGIQEFFKALFAEGTCLVPSRSRLGVKVSLAASSKGD
jgi:hypothetical protein